LKISRELPIVGANHMISMLLNIVIGLAGWTILAVVGGLCIGNAVRVFGELEGSTTTLRTKQHVEKTA
jgi:branched-subunit amino acid ABC-type transport system permease component